MFEILAEDVKVPPVASGLWVPLFWVGVAFLVLAVLAAIVALVLYRKYKADDGQVEGAATAGAVVLSFIGKLLELLLKALIKLGGIIVDSAKPDHERVAAGSGVLGIIGVIFIILGVFGPALLKSESKDSEDNSTNTPTSMSIVGYEWTPSEISN